MSLRSRSFPLLLLSIVGTFGQHIIDRRNDYASFLRGPHRRMSEVEGGVIAQHATLSLVPGDLPTDTGWARPTTTDASKYRILSVPSKTRTNQWLRLSIKCDTCDSFVKPEFFARMYGPSVLPGHVTRTSDETYEVSFLPMDAGEYYMEVVLEFSSTPEFVQYPDVAAIPGYEGHLLSGFPLKVEVEQGAAPLPHDKQPFCSGKDLLLKGNDLLTGLTVGRWQVGSKQYFPDSHDPVITMNYQPNHDCALVSLDESSQSRLDQCTHSYVSSTYKESVHLILVGDSVMGMQYRHMLNSGMLPAGLQIDYIYNGGGLDATYNNVTQVLTQLAADHPKSERIVVFNSGMHDIMVLFNQMVFRNKFEHQINETAMTTTQNVGFYRTFNYRHAMERFAAFLSTYPATSIFQTTTAAWPKWGNGGLHWPGHKEQPHLLSTHAAAQYNRIALNVFSSTPQTMNIQALDAYWMSLSRPDCREINPTKGRRAKLAHPGDEVVAALVQTILTVVVSQIGCFDK